MLAIRTKKSLFTIYPEHGMQWGSLAFESRGTLVDVLSGWKPGEEFFRSGCFCMFPWVNRLENPPYPLNDCVKDANGIPLHGLVFRKSWKVLAQNSDFLRLGLEWKATRKIPSRNTEDRFQLEAIYKLGESRLSVDLRIQNLSDHSTEFSTGFHPYFRLGKDFPFLELPRSEEIHLNPANLLPVKDSRGFLSVNGKLEDRRISVQEQSLDHLFRQRNGIHVVLENPENGWKILLDSSVESNVYQYVQIYTPDDGNSIAIEPMNFAGNYLEFPNEGIPALLAREEKKYNFCIHFFSET